MPLSPRWNRVPSRPRRPVRRAWAAVEMLEVRSLLTSAAAIQWSMVPQIALDPLHGNEPDLPNTSAYVNPSDGYGVLLDASHSAGIQSTTTFAWTVTNSSGFSASLSGEDPSINLQQGPYTVQLTATGLQGSSGPQVVTTQVQVKDILIVSIGDSIASGEGNPVVASAFDPQWAYSPDPAMNTENANAHRSTISGPAQFALQLQEANPQEAVTFVSVADSGATIPRGVLGPMRSIGNTSVRLPAQIKELQGIIGSRHIDVLTVSVGADDIKFSTIAKNLILNTQTFGLYPSLRSILSRFRANLRQLPSHYAALAPRIQKLDPGQVLVTDYPDITRDQNGNVAAILGPLDNTLISQKDAQFASRKIIPALDQAVANAANRYRWSLVQGINSDFLTHGYPSTTSWVRTLGQSLEMQGDDDGTFHPNADGQQDFAAHLLQTYMANLGGAGSTP